MKSYLLFVNRLTFENTVKYGSFTTSLSLNSHNPDKTPKKSTGYGPQNAK